jgi:hypothetical protein
MARYCHVERTVRAFQSNRSQATADRLTHLLDQRIPTQAQAARILKLLLQPVVVTRSAYPLGRKPTIGTLLPFPLRFNTRMTCRSDIFVDGQDLLAPQFSMSTNVGTGPRLWTLPAAPAQCGKVNMELMFSYSLVAPPHSRYPTNRVAQCFYNLVGRIIPRRRSTAPKEKPYRLAFRMPVDIDVVPEAEAEQVQLLSSPELDAHMRDALRPDTSADASFSLLHIFARRLPANVVFNCFLELPDGARIRSSWGNRHPTGYAGRDFEVYLWPSEYRVPFVRLPGAKAVFEPDPNYAFEDPTIHAIWNGRLEFPICLEPAPQSNEE